MATIPCPACGLPRAEDLFGQAPCPLCGHVGASPPEPEPPPAAPAAPPPAEPAPVRSGRRFLTGPLAGFLVGIPTGVAGLTGWQACRDHLPNVGLFAEAQADTPVDVDTGEPILVPIPPPAPPATTPSTAKTPPVPPKAPPTSVNPPSSASPRTVQLDGAQTYAPLVEPGASVVVRGRVKKLVVGELRGGAVFDCSDLTAEEVIVVGRVADGSRLSVRAPGGKVTFLAGVYGGAAVGVTARAAEFRSRIGGAGTKVTVSLTAGGSLAFAEIDGPARLEYAKAAASDPEPTLTRGRVGGPAVVARLE